jgi:uncharacterized membrane protein HdeD (DUF308 family)
MNPEPGTNLGARYNPPIPFVGGMRESLQELQAGWCWFVLLGILLMVLGLAAMSYAGFTTLVTALFFGYFMIVGGICYLVGAFFTRAWGGFFLSLLTGLLYIAVGVIILERPAEAVLIYTLLLAVFFFVEGIFRIVGALAGRFHAWGWMLFNGIVTLALGVMIWRQWPLSGLFVVGLFVGINLFISGVSYLSLGLMVRRLPH